MAILTRTTVTGWENLPKKGPLILVGNHVAVLEAAMMALYAPWLVEIIGAGEIPLDPSYVRYVNWYGYIPIQRGEMDREALNSALGVLKQGGVVGIFPEGGIWESTVKRARTGVSWLSYQGNAPVVPIGFGGIDGALANAAKLKRPRITMNIGQPIPPVGANMDAKSRKAALEEAANMIMDHVADLIPEADKQRWNRIRDEQFELQFEVRTPAGVVVPLPAELQFARPDMLAKFFHRPLLLDVLARNLKRPVQPLQHLRTEHDPKHLADATQVYLDYLDNENPQFLSYRFGYDEAGGMKEGLIQLCAVGRWAEQHGYQLYITPIRRYRRIGSTEEIVEERPGGVPEL
jgi:1-acyl-sn-glycerol-3-phosphate acyltransferase